MKNWLQKGDTLKNSPVPASQLPYRTEKNYNPREIVKEKVQNSKPTPEVKPKTKIDLLKEEKANKLKKKFKKGGDIEIKEENKGKFTATKKETGKSTEELTHSKNPVTKKRAVFAQNSAKWKHKEGGNIEFISSLIESFQKGGNLKATTDSTKYYQKQTSSDIENHFKAKGVDAKADAAKEASKSKNSLNRQANKGKPGYDKNGFVIQSKQRGGTVGEGPKEGDTAAVYKKGVKIPEKKGKIDSSKWKK